MVIQELWFQFLCINPSSEQPWFFFHLIEWQNLDWFNSLRAVLRMGRSLLYPQHMINPSGEVTLGEAEARGRVASGEERMRKGAAGPGHTGRLLPGAVPTGRLRASHASNSKVVVMLTAIVSLTAPFTTSPSSWATDTTTLLPQYLITSLFSLLTFYPVIAHWTHLCRLQKNVKDIFFLLNIFLNLSRAAVNYAIYTHLYKHTHTHKTYSVYNKQCIWYRGNEKLYKY